MVSPGSNPDARGVPHGNPRWTILASSGQADGGFDLLEEMRASPGGPAPHVHRERDEGFYVLEGRYVFTRGSDELEIGPGDSVFVPRGTRHHFRTLVAPSRTLIVVAPAGLAGFFREMAAMIADGATPFAAMTALSGTYDTYPVP